MYKSNAQARADSLSFNETDGEMHLDRQPILWTGERQVSGDKITAFFRPQEEILDSIKVIGNALAISKVDSLNLKDEFNQVKGKYMQVWLKDNEADLIKVIENAQAITYAESQNPKTKAMDRMGITLSTCGEIAVQFQEKRADVISCNIGANTDVYPMSKIAPERRKFPDFNWNTRDRLRKWEDIFLDTPNYEVVNYEPDTLLYDHAETERRTREVKETKRKKK